jgi:hypothetical protein
MNTTREGQPTRFAGTVRSRPRSYLV